MVGDHRLAGLKSITGRTLDIGPHPRAPYDTGLPANAGLHHKLMLGGQVFHDLAEPALEPLRTNLRRLLEKSANVVGPESKQPELGGQLLLAKPVGQLLGGPAFLLCRRGRSRRLICIHVPLSPKLARGLIERP